MKIFIYCQHVLGLGHYYRTLEICRALDRHEIVMIAGGRPVDAKLPSNLREIRLPELMMDQNFSTLLTPAKGRSVDAIKKKRRQMLFGLYKREKPEVLLLELYPFGRRAFAYEIDPLLKGIRRHILKPSLVVCSLRDILVGRKKNYQDFYESNVVGMLNRYFDALLVHADPTLLQLDQTFGRATDITIPLVYTGFITPAPPPAARRRIRAQLKLHNTDKLIIASLGGGNVGETLLKAVIRAFRQIGPSTAARLLVFTGPFMDSEAYDKLRENADDRIQIERFCSDFISYLAAADLSISMAGYNTCMNILASRVPALVWPFWQNREQGLRAERLAQIEALGVLTSADLEPRRLSARMKQVLSRPNCRARKIDLCGAAHTAEWLQNRVNPDCRPAG